MEMSKVLILMGLAVCFLGLFFGSIITWKEERKDYDERQIRIRGSIYRNSFWVMMGLGIAVASMFDLFAYRFLDGYTCLMFVLMIGAGVFSVQSARYGVMYGFRKQYAYPRVAFLCWGFIAIVSLIDGIEDGILDEQGKIVSSAVYGTVMLITSILGLVSATIHKKESESEE